jgi:hypothetical protein
MKTKLTFTLAAFCFAVSVNAQKPFKELGLDDEVEVLTLSNGRYIEHFTYDTLRQIGSVMFNTVTGKVEYFISDDDSVRQHVIMRVKEASRFLSVDPLARKYPELSPYAFVANNPINNIDPDGRDIVALVDKEGARGAGHQAALIGNEKSGFFYVSKDGFTGSSGTSKSKSHYSVVKFKDIAEFKNSIHNYVLEEGSNYSDKNPVFKLDKDGNKIQRYDDAYRITTDPKTDYPATIEAIKSAQSDYQLCKSDCSDVLTAALKKGKTPEGEKLKTGDDGIEFDIPVYKHDNIKANNEGTSVDIKPTKVE